MYIFMFMCMYIYIWCWNPHNIKQIRLDQIHHDTDLMTQSKVLNPRTRTKISRFVIFQTCRVTAPKYPKIAILMLKQC